MPIDVAMGIPPEDHKSRETFDDYVADMETKASQAYKIVRQRLRVVAQRSKRDYDIHVKEVKYKVGDWVYYYNPRRYRGKSPKWQRLFTGPFLVTRVIAPSNYALQKTQRSKPFVVHCDKLKTCYDNHGESWLHDMAIESDGDDNDVDAPEPDAGDQTSDDDQ
jgi:hypothetical protein